MGGGAFAQAAAAGHPTLTTPRMSPEEYTTLKSIYLTKIQNVFPTAHVACHIEAPEKPDYGDLDIFIAIDEKVDFISLATALGAVGIINTSGGGHQTCSLAVTTEGQSSERPPVVYKHSNGNNESNAQPPDSIASEKYTQIDLEIIEPDMLPWHIFYFSGGDLNRIMGHAATNLGFTISDSGLWLRLQELDDAKAAKTHNIADMDGRIFLSKDPIQVMHFMGLSVERWEAGFKTAEEIYQWMDSCRFIFPESLKTQWASSNDRQLLEKRKIYARYFKEWLPKRFELETFHDEETRKQKTEELRKQFRTEAVEVFEKHTEVLDKSNAIVRQMQNATATELLTPLIAKHSGSGVKKPTEIIRGFRRYVGFDSSEIPHVIKTPFKDEDSELYMFLAEDGKSFCDPRATDAFVEQHWKELKKLVQKSTVEDHRGGLGGTAEDGRTGS